MCTELTSTLKNDYKVLIHHIHSPEYIPQVHNMPIHTLLTEFTDYMYLLVTAVILYCHAMPYLLCLQITCISRSQLSPCIPTQSYRKQPDHFIGQSQNGGHGDPESSTKCSTKWTLLQWLASLNSSNTKRHKWFT